MIIVHHLNNSRSQRVLWMLEELGVAYEVRRYERDRQTMLAPRDLKTVHPLGKAPVVVDGDLVLAESGAIIEYLADRYGAETMLLPADGAARLQAKVWLHYAEGSLMPPLLLQLVFARIGSSPMPFFAKPIARKLVDKVMSGFVGPQLETHLGYVEAHLAARAWFVGDALSVADIQMSFPLEAALGRSISTNAYPNIAAFVGRCQSRPAYQRALVAGGPYDYAP